MRYLSQFEKDKKSFRFVKLYKFSLMRKSFHPPTVHSLDQKAKSIETKSCPFPFFFLCFNLSQMCQPCINIHRTSILWLSPPVFFLFSFDCCKSTWSQTKRKRQNFNVNLRGIADRLVFLFN